MIELILIISLAIIFVILLRKLPEVNIDEMSDSSFPVAVKKNQAIMSHGHIKQPAPQDENEKLWQVANLELENKNFSKAEKLFIKFATLQPDNPEIYGKLGLIYLEQKNYLDARESYVEAIKFEPKNALWLHNLGLALFNLKRFSESIDYYKKSVAIEPNKASRFFNLGLAYEACGDHKNALQAYERAAKLEPDNVEFQGLIERIRLEINKTH
ncbi:MAG TPA: tetratricopeptide repeat protein [Patescibacteria group bacterium]|nr:tetratricopeptide repeat protein [Patescibacteria group bacterium]